MEQLDCWLMAFSTLCTTLQPSSSSGTTLPKFHEVTSLFFTQRGCSGPAVSKRSTDSERLILGRTRVV